MYGIPKIHKPGNPLRPIVSQINGPCYRMNQLIHEILLVAESEIRFYLKIPQLTHRSSNVIKTSLVIHHYEGTLHCWHAYNTKVLPVKTIY